MDATYYARSAVATIGIQSFTFGCLSHAIQVYNVMMLVKLMAITVHCFHFRVTSLSWSQLAFSIQWFGGCQSCLCSRIRQSQTNKDNEELEICCDLVYSCVNFHMSLTLLLSSVKGLFCIKQTILWCGLFTRVAIPQCAYINHSAIKSHEPHLLKFRTNYMHRCLKQNHWINIHACFFVLN